MTRVRVCDIMEAWRGHLPALPAVESEERISRAVETMVQNNLKVITVVRRGRPVGCLDLGRALDCLGLRKAPPGTGS